VWRSEMHIEVISEEGPDAAQKVASRIGIKPFQFVSLQFNCTLHTAPLGDLISSGAVIGATSALGSMSDQGVSDGIVAFVVRDPDGDYGVGAASLGKDPAAAGREATLKALSNAGRDGERPTLVWVMTTPGDEEIVLEGIQQIVGLSTPIVGGSAADNTVSGNWKVLAEGLEDPDCSRAVAVAVLFPSTQVYHAYQNGYAPTETAGTVTRAQGRVIHEIDGRAAAEVYSEWTGGRIVAGSKSGVSPILADSTFFPLGREIAALNGVPQYLLAHPSGVDENASLHLFADVSEGETLRLMEGSVTGLVSRAGRVAQLARATGQLPADQVAGALMVYCGGCMFPVRESLEDVVDSVKDALPDAPFAGYFSFGEQGPVVGEGNRHGNLMISCLVFAKSA
jgi:hypothetical protein